MEFRVDVVAFLLLIAGVVAMVTRRFHLPYSVGLVSAGLALGIIQAPFSPVISLTKDLVYTALLPPLIFEAAFHIPWPQLRRDFGVIVVLATLGVLLAGTVTTVGMHYLVHWEWLTAALFGSLIAATDPVSVVAIFREAGARGRLLLLVESESLFNDGTAAVCFGVVAALAEGYRASPLAAIPMAAVIIGGGILCGAAVAACLLALAGHTEDHLVEITFTTVAAYGSFLLAESLHMSGVLATLTTGLITGNFARTTFSARGLEAVEAFWDYAAFVANSFVFLLLGIRGARQNLASAWLTSVIGFGLVMVGRAVAIYPCCFLFARSSRRIPARYQHVLFWGGLRGALALALATGIPPRAPDREAIITVSFSVVACSIFLQGLTMKPLLRRLGEIHTRESPPDTTQPRQN